MRRAKRITALAVAAAMVFSNVAYAAPGTDTTTTQAGAESAESLNSQSDASGGIEGQASDQTGNGTDSSAQAEQQTETKKTDTQNTTTDAGSQTEAQTTQEETAKEETTKDETSSQTPSTDTQTQETPSTDAEAQKVEEKQEASKTEEEKVLYDITFETPEKHGKVTDMYGNEVADGKTLKTDENGKVQFKVKADDGYQVSAVYQMPDEKTPLKLVKDSYYELQVDKNTTVKVVYQKIPEKNDDSEDADSKAEESKEDAGEQAEDQQKNESSKNDQKSDDSEKQKQTGENAEQSKPAQTVSTTASDGAKITVKATEGALPSDVTVTATPVDSNLVKAAVEKAVNSEGKQLLNYKAYDITILDSEGNEIQPDKNISVSISNAGVAGEEKTVYHIADGAKKAEKVADVSKGDVSTFSVNHFSIYVVAGSEEVDPDEEIVTVTISFTYESGAIAADPYVLTVEKKDEQYIVDYDIPEKDGYTPQIIENESGEFSIDNNSLKAVLEEKGSYQVEIQYIANTTEYTVKHLYENLEGQYVEDVEKRQTMSGKVGSLTDAKEIVTDGFTALTIQQQPIEDGGTTVVEVKYERNTYTLTYMTTGGSYVPSVSAKYGSEIELVSGKEEPTRTGYSFEGWYTDEKLQTEADSPFTLKDDTKLYAKWDGKIVGYKIVYMTENADDDEYSYVGTVSLQAKAGTEVTADTDTRKPTGFDGEHFTFLDSTKAVVEADGSTVIIARYSRNKYTITFRGSGGSQLVCGKEAHTHSVENGCYELECPYGGLSIRHWWHNESCYDKSHTICGKEEHRHTDTCYEYREDVSITAKYQADISQMWLNTVGTGKSWVWDGSKETSFQTTMPGYDKTVSEGDLGGSSQQKMTYYVEDPNGNVTFGDKKFTEYISYTIGVSSNSHPTLNEEFYVIDGYDRYGSNLNNWSINEVFGKNHIDNESKWEKDNRFYYVRHEYELELVSGADSNKYNVPYQDDFSQYLENPKAPDSTMTFEGWYLDPEFQTLYSGDYKMPKGLVLYAKWQSQIFTVNFVDSENPQTVFDSQKIESKDLVDVVIPEKQGYIFKGWYTDPACTEGKEFDYATQITQNMTLYAKWEANTTTSYTVKYVTADGKEVAEPETHTGKVGTTVQATAVVAAGEFERYTVDRATQTLELKPDASQNVIVFTYTQAGELKYTVKYVTESGNELLVDKEKTSDANYIKVTVDANALNEIYSLGYKPQRNYQWVSLTTGENVVTFVCDEALYKITYKGVGEAENKNPTTYNAAKLKDNPITLKDPVSNNNQVFVGWEFTSKDGIIVSTDHNPSNTTISYGSYGDLEFTV